MDSSDLVNLSPSAKIGGAVVGVGALGTGYALFDEWRPYILTLAIGFLAVALVLFFFFLLRKLRGKARSKAIAQQIPGGTPGAVKKADQLAQLDAMRRAFEQGIARFRDAGRSLYSTPWYLLVGEPGGGKTEAIRHSQVRFFPGLQDFLQGTGGTINMNWWFTKDAIILDTAGRTFLGDVEAGTTPEWDEFLRLLKQHRAHCPINGLLLMIPANTLISDSSEEITQKSGRIAAQFERLQMSLGVRFPVFIVITKCDLIGGFNEFFDNLADPRQQNQILGWSNPSPLDAEFDPKLVEEHLKTVRSRLLRRRLRLLVEPIQIADNESTRRLDQVDSLYTFGDNLLRIAPRLQQYLETIFVAGAWSQRPLFLRGIYFTSSIQKGSPLDPDLAAALGIPVSELPKDREWDRTRSYFLRDLFMEKVFPEKGLVTRVVNVESHQRRRKVGVLTTAFIATLGLLAWTAIGFWDLHKNLLDHLRFADRVRDNFPPAIVNRVAGDVAYNRTWSGGETVPQLLEGSMDRLKRRIEVSAIYKPVAGGLQGIQNDRRRAHEALVQSTLLVPLYRAVGDKMGRMPNWSDAARVPLEELVRAEQAVAGDRAAPKPSVSQSDPPARISAMFEYVLTDSDLGVYKADRQTLDRVVAWTYGEGGATWPPKQLAGNAPAIENAIRRYIAYCTEGAEKSRSSLNTIANAKSALADFAAAQRELLQWGQNWQAKPPETTDEYAARAKEYRDGLAKLHALRKALDTSLQNASAMGWGPSLSLSGVWDRIAAENRKATVSGLRSMRAELGDTKTLAPSATLLDQAIADINTQNTQAEQAMNTAELRNLESQFLSPLALKQEALDRLSGLDKSLAGKTLGTPQYGYEMQVHMLDLAEAFLTRAERKWDANAVPGIATLAGLLEQCKTDYDFWKNSLASDAFAVLSTTRPTGDTASRNDFKDLISYVRDQLALRYERYRILNDALSSAPSDAGWSEWVAFLAAARSTPKEAISIPLTKVGPDQFDPRFDREPVKRLAEAWDQANRLLAEKPSALVNAAGIGKLREDRANSFGKYLREYHTYWSQGVLDLLALIPPKTWAQCGDALNRMTVPNAVLGLGQLNHLAGTSLDAGESAAKALGIKDPPDWAKAHDDVAAAQKELDASVFQTQWKLILGSWQSIAGSQNPDDASETLLRTKLTDFRGNYLTTTTSALNRKYWGELPRWCVAAIADQVVTDRRKAIKSLMGNYRKFPLSTPDPNGNELDPVQLADALKLLKSIKGVTEYSSDTLGAVSLKEPENVSLDKELDKLRGKGDMSADERTWIKRAQPLAENLIRAQRKGNDPLNCTVSCVDSQGIESPDLFVFQGDFKGKIKKEDDVHIRNIRGAGPAGFDKLPLDLLGPPLVIKLGALQHDEDPAGEWKDDLGPTRWPLLRMMYDYCDKPDQVEVDKTTNTLSWSMKVPIKTIANGQGVHNDGSVTLKFRFSDPQFRLPQKNQWPGLPADPK